MAVWTLSGPWYLEDMKNLVHQEQQSVLHDITAAILVSQNNEMAAVTRFILCINRQSFYRTLFLCENFLLFQ